MGSKVKMCGCLFYLNKEFGTNCFVKPCKIKSMFSVTDFLNHLRKEGFGKSFVRNKGLSFSDKKYWRMLCGGHGCQYIFLSLLFCNVVLL